MASKATYGWLPRADPADSGRTSSREDSTPEHSNDSEGPNLPTEPEHGHLTFPRKSTLPLSQLLSGDLGLSEDDEREFEGQMRKAKIISAVEGWLEPLGCDRDTIDTAIMLFEENYLRFMPPLYNLEWPNPDMFGPQPPWHWRYRVRRELARLLSWTEQRVEFDPEGFPRPINRLLREDLWPGKEPKDGGDKLNAESNSEEDPIPPTAGEQFVEEDLQWEDMTADEMTSLKQADEMFRDT